MSRAVIRLSLFACLVPVLAGCGTLANTFEPEPENKIYVGVRADLGAVGHGGLLDLPFSFVLDTLLLPYTIPKTIANHAAEGERPEDTEPGKGGDG